MVARGPLFCAEDVTETAARTGLRLRADPGAIARMLDGAFREFALHARMGQAARASEHETWAREVARAASALARLLGLGDPGDVPDLAGGGGVWLLARELPEHDAELMLRVGALVAVARAGGGGEARPPSDAEALATAAAGVPVIERAAALAADRWRARRVARSARQADSAERLLIARLCAAYRAAFGRAARLVVPRDVPQARPGGPAIEWLQAVLGLFLARAEKALRPSARDRAWRARLRVLASDGGRHALAHRVRAARAGV
ncbi:MAG: hypothetical protein N3D18_06735 [Roseococcus sp.]|nr:hypothetical protein [Roseococcus sp.]